MKHRQIRAALVLLSCLACQGCAVYTESFSFTNRPGDTNLVTAPLKFKAAPPSSDLWPTNALEVDQLDHTPRLYTVKVKFITFFQWGKASRLQTLTKTREFVRTVNGDGLETGVDAEAVKAATEGVTEAALKFFVPKP